MVRCASFFPVMLLALAGCAQRERPPAPYFAIPPVPAIPEPARAPAGAWAARPVLPPRADVQYFLPSHPEDVMRGPTPVPVIVIAPLVL